MRANLNNFQQGLERLPLKLVKIYLLKYGVLPL
jgi:hypothetical protein